MRDLSWLSRSFRVGASALTVALLAACASAPEVSYSELALREEEPGRVLWLDPETLEAEREARMEKELETRRAREELISRALASRDIVVGMTLDEVQKVWGEPLAVEYAGEQGSPHQRWTYSDGTLSRYGMAPERVLYFENGRVSGWETVER